MRVEIARHGGHVGFMERRGGRLGSWLARRVARQLEDWAPTFACPARRLATESGPPGR